MLSRALRIARGAFLHPNDRAVETGNPAREAGSRFVREQMLSRFHFLQMGVWRYFCTRMIEWWKLAVLPALLKVVFSESKSAPIFCETVCAAESGRSHSVPSECAPDSEFAPGGAGRACTCFLTPFSQCRGGGSPMAALLPLAFLLAQLPLSRETGASASRHSSVVLGYGAGAPWLLIALNLFAGSAAAIARNWRSGIPPFECSAGVWGGSPMAAYGP